VIKPPSPRSDAAARPINSDGRLPTGPTRASALSIWQAIVKRPSCGVSKTGSSISVFEELIVMPGSRRAMGRPVESVTVHDSL
jgi:hypothetical protein